MPFPPIAIFDVLKAEVLSIDSVATCPPVWPERNDGNGVSTTSSSDRSSVRLTDGD